MKQFLLAALILTFYGCSTSEKVTKQEKCPKIYENDYTEILNEKHLVASANDTTFINEIRFECVYSMFYTHKVMFDKFGMWDNKVFLNNTKHPILIWKNVDLFSDGKKYAVYTEGLEEWRHIYASIMIFDENDNDLLAEDSVEKEKLISYFSNLIKNQDNYKTEFYELYWKMVDPLNWRRIQQYNKKN